MKAGLGPAHRVREVDALPREPAVEARHTHVLLPRHGPQEGVGEGDPAGGGGHPEGLHNPRLGHTAAGDVPAQDESTGLMRTSTSNVPS